VPGRDGREAGRPGAGMPGQAVVDVRRTSAGTDGSTHGNGGF
jgi:hypothetical protein